MTRLSLLLLLPGTLACTAVFPDPGAPHPVRPTPVNYTQRWNLVAVERDGRKEIFDQALRTGDASRLSDVFTSDVELRTLAGQSLHGLDAVRTWFEQQLGGEPGTIQAMAARGALCANGAAEWEGRLLLSTLGDSARPLINVFYSMQWTGPDKDLRIARLSFAREDAISEPRSADCRVMTAFRPVPAIGRTQLSYGSPLASTAQRNLLQQIAPFGYDEPLVTMRFSAPWQHRSDQPKQVQASQRLFRGLHASAVMQTAPVALEAIAYQRRVGADNSVITANFETRHHAVMLGWQYRNLRFSGGPVVQKSEWTVVEERRSVTSGIVMEERFRGTLSESKSGVLMEGLYQYPLMRHLFLEARLQRAVVPSSRFEASALPRPLVVPHSSTYGSISVGVGF